MSPRAAERYWLLKSDPETFSWEDLQRAPGKRTVWDGVRNYQARNLLRDDIAAGDLALFYHSSAEPPAVVGIVRVTRKGFPDPSQFDPKSPYHDPDSSPEDPRWFSVEICSERALPKPVSLPDLRTRAGLEDMVLLRRGSRLSVQPVSAKEWKIILRRGGAKA
jgi:predicted RNA-binding protein with PUA-like domain